MIDERTMFVLFVRIMKKHSKTDTLWLPFARNAKKVILTAHIVAKTAETNLQNVQYLISNFIS